MIEMDRSMTRCAGHAILALRSRRGDLAFRISNARCLGLRIVAVSCASASRLTRKQAQRALDRLDTARR